MMETLSQTAPRTVDDWCAFARAERAAGRIDRAEAGLRRALALGSAAAPFDLASLLLDRGDVAGAGAIAAAMASGGGDRPDVLWLRARIAMARGEAGEARGPLERLAADPRVTDAQRAEALLTLGLALDELGEPAAAFAAAARGKAIQRALHAAQARAREGEVAKLRRIADWIAATPAVGDLPPRSPVPGEAAVHVFLLGFPRSGTTLLEQVLGAHPAVRTLEEEATLATAYQAFLSDAGACDALLRLSGEEAAGWAEHYWRGVAARGVDVAGRVFVDKQPAGTVNLPVIARLFPRARVLFAVRDPRDVVLSCFRQPFGLNAMTYAFTDLAETARCYDACLTLAGRACAALPLAWADVRHEALVDDLAGEVARVLASLGLEPHPATLDVAAAAGGRTIRTPSARQLRGGLSRRGLGRWRRFEAELGPVLPVLEPWVERFGYPP